MISQTNLKVCKNHLEISSVLVVLLPYQRGDFSRFHPSFRHARISPVTLETFLVEVSNFQIAKVTLVLPVKSFLPPV